MITRNQSPRSNAWAFHVAALGLAPWFGVGASATNGLAAQTSKPSPAYAVVNVIGDDRRDEEEDENDAQLESRAKELGEQIIEDLGPAGEELLKAWDRALTRAGETLKSEGLSGEGLRDALEDIRDEISSALEEGSPAEMHLRQALDRVRGGFSRAGEEFRHEFRETARRDFSSEKGEGHKRGHGDRSEKKGGDREESDRIKEARKEVHELARKLHQAVERLRELRRESGREDGDQHGPKGEHRRGHDEEDSAKGHEGHHSPEAHKGHEGNRPRGPEREFGRPGRGPRGEGPRGGEFRRGPGRGPGPEGHADHHPDRPGAHQPGGPAHRPEELRFRALEEKVDRLIKELDRMKSRGGKEEKPHKTNTGTEV